MEQSRQMMGVLTGMAPEMLKQNPTMPWNGPLTSERRFAWVELPLQEVQTIRTALGGTVNDIAMELSMSAVGTSGPAGACGIQTRR